MMRQCSTLVSVQIEIAVVGQVADRIWLNGVATIYTLTGPDDMAYNTPGQESVVKVSEKSLKNTKQVKVGPFSANVIVLGTE